MRTSAAEREEETCERRVRSYARHIAAAAVLRGRGRARRQRSPQRSHLAVRTALSARPPPPTVDGPFLRGAPLPFSTGCVNRFADISWVIRDMGSERRRRRRLAIVAIRDQKIERSRNSARERTDRF